MEYIGKKEIEGIFGEICTHITRHRDELIQLDGDLGDGDLGITMDKGFRSIMDNLEKLGDEEDLGIIMKKSGFTMARVAPSTMGTLLALGIMKSGEAVSGKKTVTLLDIRDMLEKAIHAIVSRSMAKNRGDKSILDALYPAFDALCEAIDQNKTIKEAFSMMSVAAKAGSESTINMQSTVGKAAIYREKSIGKIDPGSVVIALIFQSAAEHVHKHSEL